MSTIYDYARSQGLQASSHPLLDGPICYGTLHDYDVTILINPFGLPELYVSTTFPTQEQMESLSEYLSTMDLKTTYHITTYQISDNYLYFIWNFYPDNIDSKDIIAFIDWFFPLLSHYDASSANICTECGHQIISCTGKWYNISGTVIIRHLHKKYSGKVARLSQQGSAFIFRKYPTYKRGILGAFLGSIPVTLLWAFAYQYGDIVVPTGLAVTFLTWMGYTFNCGFRGRLKPLIWYGMILCSILLGYFLHPLFGEPIHSPDSTTPAVLLFMSHAMALFLFLCIWVAEVWYYAGQKKSGLGGVITFK